jgi:hypothetical protein
MYYLSEARVSASTTIMVERLLPVRGEVVRAIGERVGPVDVVARATTSGPPRLINVARALTLREHEVEKYMLKAVGDTVEAAEPLAARRGVLPFTHRVCRAPVAGRIVAIAGGLVALEEQKPLELRANVTGVVSSVMPSRGVVIELVGMLIEGAWGMGGETYGVLRVVTKERDQPVTVQTIDVGCHGTIVAGGARLEMEALRQAENVQVRGIIAGSLDATIRDLDPPPSIPIIATEGFGAISMAAPIFDLLKSNEGREVSVIANTQTRWGRVRPQIIVLSPGEGATELRTLGVLEIGDTVRALRNPYAGQTGQVVEFIHALRLVESGLRLRGAQVDLGGTRVFVPALNLERIR